jgi:hypothetical protein
MNENEKNRCAFEACGYMEDVDAKGWWWHPDGLHQTLLDPWSSADAAIAHAERGGFIFDEHVAISRGQGQWVVDLYGEKMKPSIGHDKNLGLAIREAILAWKERNP